MTDLLVSGLINLETTLRVDRFPIDYSPVRYPFFGVNSTVSGVGYNIAKALTILNNQVNFLSLIGKDQVGELILSSLDFIQVSKRFIHRSLEETPQSVILYDGSGQRAINVDLKNIQECAYPEELFEQASAGCAIAILCNINFSRPFLQKARLRNIPIATDVHAIASLDDEYNKDFMAAAEILFMSDERLPSPPRDWARQLLNRYGTEIIVIGLGAKGALLSVKKDGILEQFPAVYTRPVVNTIGAGDALFSAFLHLYCGAKDPYMAMRKALAFASYKIGATSAADGFLDEQGLERLFR
jgi:ribokinase